MKIAKSFMIFIIVISFLGGCGGTKDEIKIGAILPLTGDGARYGVADKNGFDLALTEIKDLNIKIIYEDDQGTSSVAVNAFNKLASIDNVPLIIGLMYSSVALSIAPLGEENKVVLFSTTASSPELTKAGDYFFRNWPSDIFEGTQMAEFAFGRMQFRTTAIIAVNLDYGVGLTKVFQEAFAKIGGDVLSIEYYSQNANDFRAQLNKVKQLNPDCVYLPGYYSEIGKLLKQAKELGIQTQFLSCVGFNNTEIFNIAGNAAENVIFARPSYNPNSEEVHVKKFVRNFAERYGENPGIYAAHAYDALLIVAESLKIGGKNPEDIKKALYKIKDFPGVTGNTTIDENGDVIKTIQFMRVNNRTFQSYE